MMGVRSKSCESCKTSPATIFCKTDSVYLCLVCDSKIHVVSTHPRVWLCDVCENSPAAFTCKADAASLCVSCDRDIHSANPLALRHHRAPVIPFGGVDDDDHCSEEAEAASWLLPNPPDDDDQKKPPISPSNSNSNNYSCCDGVVPSNYPPPPLQVDGFPAYNLESTPFFYNFNSITQTPVSSSSMDVALVPDHNDANSESQLPNPISGLDREARVLRYREKRKNRKFQKTIRYASRKAYAETRPRIKGRFAKRTEIDHVQPLIHASTYGVVPSY